MKDTDVNKMLRKTGAINFSIESLGGVETLQKKDGGTYEKQNVNLVIPATSEKITVQLFVNFSSKLKAGEILRGEPTEEAYPKWIAPWELKKLGKDVQETNAQQVKNERAVSEAIESVNMEKVIYDWKVGLSGLVQAMITAGIDDSKIMGEAKPHEGTMSAVEWATWIRSKAKEMAEKPDTSNLPF